MKARDVFAPSGFALVEEALEATRRAPAAVLACHLIGAAPFVAVLIWFWAAMRSSAYADRLLLPGALACAVLYLWMIAWQSRAMRLQLAWLHAEPPPPMGLAAAFRLLCRQGLIQSSGLILYPLAFLVLMPLPWLHAFYHHAATIDDGDERPLRSLARQAAVLASRWQGQNTIVVWLLSPLAYPIVAVLWLNMAPALVMLDSMFYFGLFIIYAGLFSALLIPLAPFAAVTLLNVVLGGLTIFTLINAFLGIPSPFVTAAEAAVNQTYFAACLGLAYLIIDPVCRSAYVLRTHYAQCSASGEDLRMRVARLRGVAPALVLAAGTMFAASAASAEAAPERARLDPAALDRAIAAELDGADYTWRMPRIREAEEESAVGGFMRSLQEWFTAAYNAVVDLVERFFDWLTRQGAGGGLPSSAVDAMAFGLRLVLVLLCAGLALALLYLLAQYLRDQRATRSAALASVDAAPPDLNDEATTADALPDAAWCAMAEDLLAKGELRLAARALHLAVLAAFARREWLTIARSKSNQEYRHEVRRRAHQSPELAAGFEQCTRGFEAVWYGSHPVGADLIARLRAHYGEVAKHG